MDYRALRAVVIVVMASAVVVALYYLFRYVDVISIIKRADPVMLAGGAGLEVFGLFLYAVSWHVLLLTSGIKIKLRRSLTVTWSSLFLLYVTPAGVLMDVSRALIVGKESGNTSASTATVIIQRVLYAFAYAIITTASIFMIYFFDRARFYRVYPFLFFVVGAAAVGVFILLASRHRGLIGWASKHVFSLYYRLIKKTKVDETVKKEAEESTRKFGDAIQDMMMSPTGALASLAIIIARLFVAATVSYWVFVSLNYFQINFWEITLVMLVGEFVTSIPIGVPGMLGFVEAAMSLSYVALGVPANVAITATLLIRLILYWWDILITGITATVSSGGLKTVLRASELKPSQS